MAQFSSSAKIEIPSPKLTIKKEDSSKMKAAMKRALIRGVQKGTSNVNRELRAALNAAMESNVWGPFKPKFPYYSKGGQLRGQDNTRSLVDTGKLKSSLKLKDSFAQTKSTISIVYTAPYARLTHYGGVILPYGNPSATPVLLPARPWIDAVMKGGYGITPFNWTQAYSDGINEAWTAQFG